MKAPQLREIVLSYSDGSMIRIDEWKLAELEKAWEAMTLLDRARRMYEQLKPIMERKE